MKAISLCQPWASLIFAPAPVRKCWETRGRAYPKALAGRRIAIQSSRQLIDRKALDPALDEICRTAFGSNYARDLPLGMIVGAVRLGRDIVSDGATRPKGVRPIEAYLGDWSKGRHAWELLKPVAARSTLLVKGYPGWFDVSSDAVRFACGRSG